MSTTTVQQDPQTGKWLVHNGEHIAEFEDSHNGRGGAHRLALSLDHPQLVQLVSRLLATHTFPGLEERAWRAAELAAKGNVTLRQSDRHGNVGRVRSQSGNEVYDIQLRHTLLCLCED